MNTKYICAALASAALLTTPVFAQEFGADDAAAPAEEPSPVQQILDNTSDLAGKPLGEDYVATVNNIGDDSLSDTEEFRMPREILGDYLRSKDIDPSSPWDEEKGRIVVIEQIEFDCEDPEIDDTFIRERSIRVEQLMLQAKAAVISAIKQTMSASRMMELPGNPLSEKFDKELEPLKKALLSAQKKLKEANTELNFTIDQNQTYTPEQIASFVESIIGKFTEVDNGNYAKELDEKKKAAFDKARKDVESAKDKVVDLQERFEAELQAIKDSTSQKSSSTIETSAEMVILGGSVLKQAEGYDEESGKYYIAIAYYWSRDLQRAAAAILLGQKMDFAKGKKSRMAWIDGKIKSGEYAWMLGPRAFIDDKGNMQIMAFECFPQTGNTAKNRSQEGIAKDRAKAEVGYSLFADASAHTKTMIEARERVIGMDKTKFEQEEKYAAEMREQFKNITISGLGPVSEPRSAKLYGLKINVVAMGVDASAANNLKAIFEKSQELGLDVRKSQSEQKGRDDALRARTAAAQDDASSYAKGAAAGHKIMDDHERERDAAKAASSAPKGNLSPAAKPAPKPAQPGRLQGGSRIIGDDDDDF